MLEANSIRLLRGFFRQRHLRALKFAAALDFVTGMMLPSPTLPASDDYDKFQGPALARPKAASNGSSQIVTIRCLDLHRSS